jgi:hypothetical protein
MQKINFVSHSKATFVGLILNNVRNVSHLQPFASSLIPKLPGVEFITASNSTKLRFDALLQIKAFDQYYGIMNGAQRIIDYSSPRKWWESYVGDISLAERERFFPDVAISQTRYRMMQYTEDEGMHFVGDWFY